MLNKAAQLHHMADCQSITKHNSHIYTGITHFVCFIALSRFSCIFQFRGGLFHKTIWLPLGKIVNKTCILFPAVHCSLCLPQSSMWKYSLVKQGKCWIMWPKKWSDTDWHVWKGFHSYGFFNYDKTTIKMCNSIECKVCMYSKGTTTVKSLFFLLDQDIGL